jgi:chemotaxis signal transduction protein
VNLRNVDLDRRVGELRDAFDRSFAERPATTRIATEDLIAIRVGGDPYAVRTAELSSVSTNRKIVTIPSRRSDLLGVAGIRGALVPVYGMASVLGYPETPSSHEWLALCGHPDLVALAFERLEGFLRVQQTDLHAPERADGSRRHVSQVVRAGGIARLVVDMRSTLTALGIDAGTSGSTRGR